MDIVPGSKIIIADNKERNRSVIKEILSRSGYRVHAEASNAPELLRKNRSIFPDLVIMDSDLEGGSVIELANIIEHDSLASILIITDQVRSIQFSDYAHISKPINEDTLLPVVEVCLLYNQRVLSLRQELETLKEDLNKRKIIEKAKGILMKNYSLDEAEAYRKMQKLSMDKSISMKDLAKAIINTA